MPRVLSATSAPAEGSEPRQACGGTAAGEQVAGQNPERYAANQRRFKESGGYSLSIRKNHLKQNYGLTLEDYDRMLESQGGVCAICGDPPRDDIALHVDHCHDTGSMGARAPSRPSLRRAGSPSAAGTPTPPQRRLLHASRTFGNGSATATRVRGLLCFKCNAGLGQFRHDLEHLQQATAYLSSHLRTEELIVDALGQRLARDDIDPDARRLVRERLAVLVAVRDRSLS